LSKQGEPSILQNQKNLTSSFSLTVLIVKIGYNNLK